MPIKKRIRKFLLVVEDIMDTYHAFPYFDTPNHVFETYIGELAEYYNRQRIDSQLVETIPEVMQTTIDFISQAIPSTAVEKSKFLDELNGERKKLVHTMETEFLHAKAV